LQVPKLKHYPVLAKGYAHFMIKFGWVVLIHPPEYVTNITLNDSKFVTQGSRDFFCQFCHTRQ